MKLRFGKLLIVPVLAMATAGSTIAVSQHAANPSKKPANVLAVSSPAATARYHGDATTCPAPSGATLAGNWTHGDFVSAWAKAGDRAKTLAASRSDCGKAVSDTKKSATPGSVGATKVKEAKAEKATGTDDNEQADQPDDVQGEDVGHGQHGDNTGDNQDGPDEQGNADDSNGQD